MNTCSNKVTIHMGKSNPKCGCGCNCNSNSGGLIKPSGGSDGDVLVKNGDTLIWAKIQNLVLPYNDTVGF